MSENYEIHQKLMKLLGVPITEDLWKGESYYPDPRTPFGFLHLWDALVNKNYMVEIYNILEHRQTFRVKIRTPDEMFDFYGSEDTKEEALIKTALLVFHYQLFSE